MKSTIPVAVALIVLGAAALPARAEMIGTPELLTESTPRERVEAFLSREDVQRELAARGVSPADAATRAASLTEAEAQAIASQVDSLPAGADLGVVELLLVILILVILL